MGRGTFPPAVAGRPRGNDHADKTRVRLVAQAMHKMVKVDIAGLQAAYDGCTAAEHPDVCHRPRRRAIQ